MAKKSLRNLADKTTKWLNSERNKYESNLRLCKCPEQRLHIGRKLGKIIKEHRRRQNSVWLRNWNERQTRIRSYNDSFC